MTELAPSTCFKELLRLLQVRWRQAHERMVLVSINILDRCKPFSLNQPPIRRQRNTILVYPCLPCFWLTSQRWGQLCCQLKDNQVYVPKGKKRPRSLRSLGLTSKSINTYEYFSTHLLVSGTATFAPQDTQHLQSSVVGVVERTTVEAYRSYCCSIDWLWGSCCCCFRCCCGHMRRRVFLLPFFLAECVLL